MAGLKASFARTAETLWQTFADFVTPVIVETPGGYDPVPGEAGEATMVAQHVEAIRLTASQAEFPNLKLRDGDELIMIRQADLGSARLTADMVLRLPDDSLLHFWRLEAVPADDPIYWTCFANPRLAEQPS